jgi:hypothetical protein
MLKWPGPIAPSIDVRNAELAKLLRCAGPGIQLSEHIEERDGAIIFAHACKLGLKNIVSKRRRLPIRIRPNSVMAKKQEPRFTASAPIGGIKIGNGLGKAEISSGWRDRPCPQHSGREPGRL